VSTVFDRHSGASGAGHTGGTGQTGATGQAGETGQTGGVGMPGAGEASDGEAKSASAADAGARAASTGLARSYLREQPSAEISPQRLQRGPGSPQHHQLFLIVRDGIHTGRYQSGKTLPSEGELARLFGVSRITVRAALATLEAEGLIERRQGIGTFVTSGAAPLPLNAAMSDVLTHMQEVSRRTKVQVIEFGKVLPPAHILAQFGAPPETPFMRAVRVRHSKLQPVMLLTTFLPLDIGERFSATDLEQNSLGALLKRSGVHLASGEQVVTATLAEPIVARQLDVNVGAPLLLIKRLHFDAHRRPVQYLETLASPATFELRMSLEAEDFHV
jgi:GntR family transcriptional regulator